MRARSLAVRLLVPIAALLILVPSGSAFSPAAWATGGANNSWEWGIATRGPVGSVVYATNLDASYNANECSWVQAPMVEGGSVSDWTLRFDQWYRLEASPSTAYDGAVLLITTNQGVSWDQLPLPGSSLKPHKRVSWCVDDYGLDEGTRVMSGNHVFWETVSLDLSSYAGASTVHLRFVFASDNAINLEGWYLKNVWLGDQQLLL